MTTETPKHNGPCPKTCSCWVGAGGPPCQYDDPKREKRPALPALAHVEFWDHVRGWHHVTSAPLISANDSTIMVDFGGALRFRTSTGRGYSAKDHRISQYSREQIAAALAEAAEEKRIALVVPSSVTPETKP